MSSIIDKNKEKNPLLNVRRNEILHREDIKTSFAYAIVGIGVIIGVSGLSYLFIKQIQK